MTVFKIYFYAELDSESKAGAWVHCITSDDHVLALRSGTAVAEQTLEALQFTAILQALQNPPSPAAQDFRALILYTSDQAKALESVFKEPLRRKNIVGMSEPVKELLCVPVDYEVNIEMVGDSSIYQELRLRVKELLRAPA
ncbi:hypothetical protein [Bdellovibrio bacteriovorus]|uniref:hypothetical protein n=1 Tax=Bdellovibrio bacteriovorus TaxID=959 RepID=UPI0035A741B5